MNVDKCTHSFNVIALGDAITFQRGFDITKNEQTEGDVPIVSSSGISSFHNQWKVTGPGVVIGRKGTLGTVHYVQGNYWPHDTTLWVKDFKGNDQRFVYYFLKTLHLENFDVGASNPTLNRNHLHKIRIVFPNQYIQKKIAAILSDFDKSIENNRQRIVLLEKMAEELYREWFVRMRFPSHDKAMKIKGIPESWQVKKIGQLVSLIKDKYMADEHQEWPLVDLEKMASKTLAVLNTGHADELTTSRIVFSRNDVLFSSIRPYLYKVNMAAFSGVTNTSVMVLRPKLAEYRSFITMALFMENTIAWADQYATGTKMPVIAWNVFQKMELFDPGRELAAEFDKVVAPMLDQINNLAIQLAKLSEMRDKLVHRLISGKLSVQHLDIQFPPSISGEIDHLETEQSNA